MRKVLIITLGLLMALSLPSTAQGPSPPSADTFHQDGATFDRCTYMRLSATFSDPDGDIWEARLVIIGLQDEGFMLSFDDQTGQLGVSGNSCSPGENAYASGPHDTWSVDLDCEYSNVSGTPSEMTVVWRVANGLPPGLYTVSGQAMDGKGQMDYRVLGTFTSIAAERSCGL